MSYGGGSMDEIQRLVMRVEGEQQLKELTIELNNQRESMNKLVAAFKAGTVGEDEYARKMMNRANYLKLIKDDINGIEKAMAGGGAGGGPSAGMRQMGAQNLGYALQDFLSTSGDFAQKINSVSNNLQQFAISLGVGGGWFLAITGAVEAIKAVANNWESIEDAILGIDSTKATALKDKAKALQDKFKTLAETPGAEAAGESEQWQKSIVETGAEKLRKAIYERLFASGFGEKVTPEETQAIEFAQSPAGVATYGGIQTAANEAKRLQQKAMDRINKANADRAAEMVANATGTGPDAEAARRQIAGLNVPGFDPARKLMKSQDENMAGLALDFRKREKQMMIDLAEGSRAGEQEMQSQVKGNERADLQKQMKRLELPQLPDTPESINRQQQQDASRQIQAMESQAQTLAENILMRGAMGFDTSGLQQALQQVQQAWMQQQQQLQSLQMRLGRGMGGQMGGGQFSAQPFYEAPN